MDNFFPGPDVTTKYTHVTPAGVVLLIVVVLLLVWFLYLKDKVEKSGFGGNPGYIKTGSALGLHDQSQTGVGSGFVVGHEPPVYWGAPMGEEVLLDQNEARKAEGRGPNNQTAGFTDSNLQEMAKGYRTS
jgi:hypothetical protein